MSVELTGMGYIARVRARGGICQEKKEKKGGKKKEKGRKKGKKKEKKKEKRKKGKRICRIYLFQT